MAAPAVTSKIGVKCFNAEFLHEVRDQMMESLQKATENCVAHAGKRFNDEMSRLQAVREQQLKEQLWTRSKGRARSRGSLPLPSIVVPDVCHPDYKADSCGAPNPESSPASLRREDFTDLGRQGTLSEILDTHLADHTPSRQITLAMTPTSSKICSSDSNSSSTDSPQEAQPISLRADSPSLTASESQLRTSGPDAAQQQQRKASASDAMQQQHQEAEPAGMQQQQQQQHRASEPAGMQQQLDTPAGSVGKLMVPEPPCNNHRVALAEVTPACGSPSCESARRSSPRIVTATTMPHQRVSEPNQSSEQTAAHEHATPIQEKSPTILEPDTIDVLRAALMDDSSCTPKPTSVMLPPASMQGRNLASSFDTNLSTPQGSTSSAQLMLPPGSMQARSLASSCDSNLPTPQGSPNSAVAFENPRGASSSPGNPVRPWKLSNVVVTPASTEKSIQAPPLGQDVQGSISSPPSPNSSSPRPNSELKTRHPSWLSTPRNPLRAIVAKVREASASEEEDGATPSHGSVNAGAAELPCGTLQHLSGEHTPQVTAALTPKAPSVAKTLPEFAEKGSEGGLIHASTVHGVASPLRRRWLGVLSSTPMVTPKPPTKQI